MSCLPPSLCLIIGASHAWPPPSLPASAFQTDVDTINIATVIVIIRVNTIKIQDEDCLHGEIV